MRRIIDSIFNPLYILLFGTGLPVETFQTKPNPLHINERRNKLHLKPQIKQLTRQTLVYGAGNVLTRFVTFLLLPLFTNILTPQEYGLITLVYVFLGFMNIIYHYGLDAAFMRHYSEAEGNQQKRRIFSTALWLVLGTSGLLSLLVFGLAKPLSIVLLGHSQYYFLFTLAAGILCFDALAHIPFAFLRMKEKAGIFVSIKLLNVLITLGLNIYLVAFLKRGIVGIFTSAFLASVITALAVFITTFTFLKPTFSSSLARSLLKFGLPFVPAGLASITMEMIDRYILAILKDTATVGIYSAGYKLGIFMLLLTTAFQYAWQPFFLKMGKTDESRSVFSKIFSYYCKISLFVWIILSAFIHGIIRLRVLGYSLIGSSYYEAESIVPIILLAYVFQGVYLNFLPGIYFEKKTTYIPIITAVGALVNIGLNLILIPIHGIMGAAIATLAGYATMSVLTFYISRRLFPIPYEWKRVFAIVFVAILSFFVILLFGQTILFKLIGIVLYIVVIFILK